MTLLSVENLCSGYGKAEVLHDVTLSVAGKTDRRHRRTERGGQNHADACGHGLRCRVPALSSFMDRPAGDVGWMVAQGVVLVPETRALFTDMSVEDNLQLGAFSRWRAGAHDFNGIYGG